MSWGTVEERAEDGSILYHVMPMVSLDGDLLVSAAHDASQNCQCRPILDGNIWQHHDPDHDGAMSETKWIEMKEKGKTQ